MTTGELYGELTYTETSLNRSIDELWLRAMIQHVRSGNDSTTRFGITKDGLEFLADQAKDEPEEEMVKLTGFHFRPSESPDHVELDYLDPLIGMHHIASLDAYQCLHLAYRLRDQAIKMGIRERAEEPTPAQSRKYEALY